MREPTPLATLAPAAARRAAALVAALLAAACGGDSGTTVKSSGDQQAWYFDNPLPDPYRVVALNVDGQPVPGVAVTWTVTSGGGTVDPPQTETDAAGLAMTTHTLGPATSTQSVTAIAPGLPQVAFTAMASGPPTSGDVTVGNDFFKPSRHDCPGRRDDRLDLEPRGGHPQRHVHDWPVAPPGELPHAGNGDAQQHGHDGRS